VSLTARTEGFADAHAALRSLELDVQRPILKRALKTAAAPIVLRAKRSANDIEDSGLLADSIHTIVTGDRAGRATANIRPSGRRVIVEQTGPDGVKRQKRTRASAYAHIVEFGSLHVSARPFMRPALDGGLAEAEAGFAAEIDAAMQRRIKKESKAQARRR
jgi:HK97 gp10 family phage protein